jgi:hypothetical protein
MMRHIVLFKRRADVARQAELERELVERMRTLPREIDFIRGWKVSANELDRPICWDYVLESTFDDRAAVERYLPHPAHVSLITALKTYFEWVACDYTDEPVATQA